MADNASRDQNNIPTLLAVSSADGVTVVKVYADPSTHRLLTSGQQGATGATGPTGPAGPSNAQTGAEDDPTGVVTPDFIGQTYVSVPGGKVWFSSGATNADWSNL